MSLKLMYITNRPEIALIAEKEGVDRIFIDMEYIEKKLRQGGMDTVQLHHTPQDVQRIKAVLTRAELLVRVNPIHGATDTYISSAEEIDAVIRNGADIVMLPYFKTPEEVRYFINEVNGRAKTMLLLETPEAVNRIDEILSIEGIDEIHIGLNDLSLGYHRTFMFELLADGTVENICNRLKSSSIPYGFGGIASLGKGMLPAEYVIMEHYRLGSTMAILSRSFCNVEQITDIEDVKLIFSKGVEKIRAYEDYCAAHPEKWDENSVDTKTIISKIVNGIKK